MVEVYGFTANVHLAVLGLHAIKEKPVAINGKVEIRPVSDICIINLFDEADLCQMMYLALTYDHRLLDGREAVTFLVKVTFLISQAVVSMLSRTLLGEGIYRRSKTDASRLVVCFKATDPTLLWKQCYVKCTILLSDHNESASLSWWSSSYVNKGQCFVIPKTHLTTEWRKQKRYASRAV